MWNSLATFTILCTLCNINTEAKHYKVQPIGSHEVHSLLRAFAREDAIPQDAIITHGLLGRYMLEEETTAAAAKKKQMRYEICFASKVPPAGRVRRKRANLERMLCTIVDDETSLNKKPLDETISGTGNEWKRGSNRNHGRTQIETEDDDGEMEDGTQNETETEEESEIERGKGIFSENNREIGTATYSEEGTGTGDGTNNEIEDETEDNGTVTGTGDETNNEREDETEDAGIDTETSTDTGNGSGIGTDTETGTGTGTDIESGIDAITDAGSGTSTETGIGTGTEFNTPTTTLTTTGYTDDDSQQNSANDKGYFVDVDLSSTSPTSSTHIHIIKTRINKNNPNLLHSTNNQPNYLCSPPNNAATTWNSTPTSVGGTAIIAAHVPEPAVPATTAAGNIIMDTAENAANADDDASYDYDEDFTGNVAVVGKQVIRCISLKNNVVMQWH